MFDRTLFRLFGIPVRIDSSWLIIAGLVTWSLATGYFPGRSPGLVGSVYWSMGILGAIGLFASVLFHEVSHALVARGFGMRIRGLRLFIFGGVAEMVGEPPSPRAEFLVAGAGPLSSFVLSGFAFGIASVFEGILAAPLRGVLDYLAGINFLLACFNLLPAFPLDGGRLLRAAIWARRRNLPAATRFTAKIGGGFGYLFVGLGVLAMIRGGILAGAWWVLIGLFLRGAAGQASRQAMVQGALEGGLRGTPVRHLMRTDVESVASSLSIRDLMEVVVPRSRYPLYPVVDRGVLRGSVHPAHAHAIPREKWEALRVEAITIPPSAATAVSAEDDALEALRRMLSTGATRLLVVEADRLVGILTLRDLTGSISDEVEPGRV